MGGKAQTAKAQKHLQRQPVGFRWRPWSWLYERAHDHDYQDHGYEDNENNDHDNAGDNDINKTMNIMMTLIMIMMMTLITMLRGSAA